MDGWIKLHRNLLQWEWYKDQNTKSLFLHCLLKANHRDIKYQGKLIKRGQFLAGRSEISALTGISEQSVRTSINRLKSTGELTSTSTSKGTLITIVNYSDWQGDNETANQQTNQQTNQQLTSNQPASNQQVTTNKKNKNEKKEKKEEEKNECEPLSPSAPPLPHGDEFAKAWASWEKHRSELKKPLKPTMIEAQLKKLGSMPEAEAVEMMLHTVTMGWQGLRAPEQIKTKSSHSENQHKSCI